MTEILPHYLKKLMDRATPELLANALRSLRLDFGLRQEPGKILPAADIEKWTALGLSEPQAKILAEIESEAATPFLSKSAILQFTGLLQKSVAGLPLPQAPKIAADSPLRSMRRRAPRPPFIGLAFDATGNVMRRTVVGYGATKAALDTARKEGFSVVLDRMGTRVEITTPAKLKAA
jgi:hypothetical protein